MHKGYTCADARRQDSGGLVQGVKSRVPCNRRDGEARSETVALRPCSSADPAICYEINN
jgi:hypothetical protein